MVVFPTDTVYGLGCDPENETAVRRLYELKGRPADRPAAVMFFDRERATEALRELGDRERAAIASAAARSADRCCCPIAIAASPSRAGRPPAPAARWACASRCFQQRWRRSPRCTGPLMQSSANLSGGAEARRLSDVPLSVREGADLLLDGGELPGVASTVLDLRDYQRTGSWSILREGAMAPAAIERALS